MLRLLSILLAVPALCLLAWLALAQPEPRADFVVASDELRTLDPHRVSFLDEIIVTGALFEGLTRTNPLTQQPEPAAAEALPEVSADGLTYTFHLREDLRWSNGAPLTADHFRWSWLRALNPRTGAQYASLLFVIAGAKEYASSGEAIGADSETLSPASRKSENAAAYETLSPALRGEGRVRGNFPIAVEAPDNRTLIIHLENPCPYFLDLTSFPTFAPVYPPLVGAHSSGERWTKPDQIVCNGPFILTRRDFKRRLLLERNPYHWENLKPVGAADQQAADQQVGDQQVGDRPLAGHREGEAPAEPPSALAAQPELRPPVPVNSIEILIASSPAAQLLAYETGQVDLVRSFEYETARVLNDQAKAGKRPDFHVNPLLATFFLRVNCTRPPFDNPELRKALSLAIDRQAICEHVLGLGEIPADTYVPYEALKAGGAAASETLSPALRGEGRVRGDSRQTKPPAYIPPDGLCSVSVRSLGTRLPFPYEERIRQARRHLEASGFDRLAATRTIELSYASDPPQQRKIMEAVQSMWEKSLGLRVELRVMERKVLSERIRQLDYDVVRSDWYGDYMDPSTFLDMYTTGNTQNRTGWSHARYDDLIAESARTSDPARRFELMRDAEKILVEDELPILPIYFKVGNYLLNPRFSGLHANPRDILPIERALKSQAPDVR